MQNVSWWCFIVVGIGSFQHPDLHRTIRWSSWKLFGLLSHIMDPITTNKTRNSYTTIAVKVFYVSQPSKTLVSNHCFWPVKNQKHYAPRPWNLYQAGYHLCAKNEQHARPLRCDHQSFMLQGHPPSPIPQQQLHLFEKNRWTWQTLKTMSWLSYNFRVQCKFSKDQISQIMSSWAMQTYNPRS